MRYSCAGKFVIALGRAAPDRNRILVARRYRLATKGVKRQNAFALVADVKDDGFTLNRDNRRFTLLGGVAGRLGMALLKLREQFAERFSVFRGSVRKIGIGHAGTTPQSQCEP